MRYEAYTVTDGFTPDELDRIISYKDAIKPMSAQEMGQGEDLRKSQIYWLMCNDDTLWAYDKLGAVFQQTNAHCFHLDIAEIIALQFTEYTGGDHYDMHCDVGYGVDNPISKRKLSLTLQLSDPTTYDGGDLLLYPDRATPFKAPRARGAITVFRSHILHKVSPVTRGVRYSLVTWCEGPELK